MQRFTAQNPDETYAKVKAADGYTYYMAEALLDTVLLKLAKKDNLKALIEQSPVPDLAQRPPLGLNIVVRTDTHIIWRRRCLIRCF